MRWVLWTVVIASAAGLGSCHTPDPNCPRFAGTFEDRPVGSGHVFGAIILGYVFADDLNATHVYDAAWAHAKGSKHGDYRWIFDFFNIHAGVMSNVEARQKYNLTTVVANGWKKTAEKVRGKCGILVMLRDNSCPTDGTPDVTCFHTPYKAYERAKWRMRRKFLSSKYTPTIALKYDRFGYNIAWHLRVGDITPHKGDDAFFRAIYGYIANATSGIGVKVNHYIFTEDRRWPIAGYGALAELLDAPVLLNHLSSEHTMYHWVNADMLVETGSSFTLMAAESSPKPVVIHSCSKGRPEFDEPGALTVEYISESVEVSCVDHRLINMSLDEMAAYVEYKFQMYRNWAWPR